MSLLERIIARRAELAEQAEHLAKELAEVERELDRVSAAEQVVVQLLAEDDVLGRPLQPGQAVGLVTSSLTPVASAAAASSPAAVSRLIAHRGQVSGPQHLPADYRALLEAVTAASGPMMCKDVCQAVGISVEPGQVEGTRAKLKRLAERGWLRKTPTGAFAALP